MAGKEVPHRKPARIVIRKAFFLVSAKILGIGKDYSFHPN
jgi:hypothetical protein